PQDPNVNRRPSASPWLEVLSQHERGSSTDGGSGGAFASAAPKSPNVLTRALPGRGRRGPRTYARSACLCGDARGLHPRRIGLARTVALTGHGAAELPEVQVDSYNAALRDADGFIGDRASNRAFRAILEDWRERLRRVAGDPLGEDSSEEISKRKLDKILTSGE